MRRTFSDVIYTSLLTNQWISLEIISCCQKYKNQLGLFLTSRKTPRFLTRKSQIRENLFFRVGFIFKELHRSSNDHLYNKLCCRSGSEHSRGAREGGAGTVRGPLDCAKRLRSSDPPGASVRPRRPLRPARSANVKKWTA